MRKQTRKKKNNLMLIVIPVILCIIALALFQMLNKKDDQNISLPSETATITPTESPAVPEETVEPDPSEAPENSEADEKDKLIIRTDYEAFKPNESGDIPVIMFHRFIEAYEPDTDKEFTTTFEEFEALLQTLYDEGYRLISMKDFIDCNISVPAGTKPMVFTFDDGTPGQFNLIEENGELKVNPKSAVGVMMKFNEKHPDFGLKGIFYINMDIGDNTFKGAGTLRQRFEQLQALGFELGSHTWGHVKFPELKSVAQIEESLGKNQEKAEEILPGLKFYSLALPHGLRPSDKSLWPAIVKGSYNGTEYHHQTVMAVGANPSKPSISKEYNGEYVARIRAQGRVPVECDLTWWLPKMTDERMFISDGDPNTIVVPEKHSGKIDTAKLNGKNLITY